MSMEFKRTWTTALAAALLLTPALPAHGQLVGRPIPRDLLRLVLADWKPLPDDDPRVRATSTPEAREAMIRQIYEAYERVARDSGFEITFSLGPFSTVRPAAYAEVRWLDQFTMGSGERVVPVGMERVNENTGESLLRYEFTWESQRPEVEERIQVMEERFGSYSILEALRASKTFDLSRPFPFLIERFEVEIFFAGQRRAYRAAGFFYGLDDELKVAVEDQIALRLDEMVNETRPIFSAVEIERRMAEWKQEARRAP